MQLFGYFEEVFLSAYFAEHLRHKDGGGWDGMNGRKYEECGMLGLDLPKIREKCLSRKYRFTQYAEKLLLKGRGKVPRVISIPTMRDRLVLGVLHEYLKNEIGLKYSLNPPSSYIGRIKQACDGAKGKIYYAKIDFSDFYGSINQAALCDKLQTEIDDYSVVELIEGAIQTPTVAAGIGRRCDENIGDYMAVQAGVPQGLPISNFLAAKHMEGFDDEMLGCYGSRYVRYVDDILVLALSQKEAGQVLEKVSLLNERQSLGLKINVGKTKTGCLDDEPEGIDFLGYQIYRNKIGVRESTLRNFEKNLSEQCVRLRSQYLEKWRRPVFLQADASSGDEKFIEHLQQEMRMTISGMKIRNRLFGWLPYFKTITDVKLLYRLDGIVKRLFGRCGLNIDASFVKSYYGLREKKPRCIVDLDAVSDVASKKAFLARKGVLSPLRQYTGEQIEELFKRVVRGIEKKQKKDIKY